MWESWTNSFAKRNNRPKCAWLVALTVALLTGCAVGQGNTVNTSVGDIQVFGKNGTGIVIGSPGGSTPQGQTGSYDYEVACGPGFAPSPYYQNPNSFSQWSCSNGGSYYNAAGACPPDKQNWVLWGVRNGRAFRVGTC